MDIAALGYDIDSSQARSAASNLLDMNRAAAQAEAGAAKLQTVFRNSNGTFKSASIYAKEHEGRIKSLAAEFNSTLSKQLQFAEAQKRLADAIRLGVVPADQAKESLERLQLQYAETGAAANKLAASNSNASIHTSNVFAQLNDIGMMMASGQSPLVLAMQQGSQLNQVWGQMGGNIRGVGAALGGAFMSMLSPINLVTIGVIALGAAAVQWLMSSENSAKTFGESLDNLQSATSNINAAYKMLSSEGMTDVFNAYGALNEKVRENVLLMAEAAIYKEFDRISEAATALRDEMTGGWLTTDIDDVRNAFGTTNDEARRYLRLIEDIGSASTFEDQAAAAKILRDELLSGGRTLNDFDGSARDIVIKVIEMADGAERLSVQVNKSKNLGEAFSKLDLAGGVNAAGDAALVLANRLGISLETARKLAALGPQGLGETGQVGAGGGRGGDPREMGGSALDYQVYQADLWLAEWEKKQKEAKKGGGGAAQKAENELERLQIALQKDSQFQIEKYERDYEVLKNSLEKGLLTKTQYKELEAALNQSYWGSEFEKQQLQREMEQQALEDALEKKYITQEQYNQRIMELQNQEREITLGHYDALFGNMATIAKAGGNKATAAVKAFSIAQGLINSYLAYTQVLADPSLIGRPFLRTALAASTLAAGLAQVANMGGGGGGAGRAGGTTSATSATASEPNRVTRVELVGDDWLVKLAESMMTQIYDASRDGRVIVARG